MNDSVNLVTSRENIYGVNQGPERVFFIITQRPKSRETITDNEKVMDINCTYM